MRLFFFLRSDTKEMDELSTQWENTAAEFIKNEFAENPLIKVKIAEIDKSFRHSKSETVCIEWAALYG